MKSWLEVIILLAVVTLMCTGCEPENDEVHYDSRLTAIDAIVGISPGKALAMLDSLPVDTFPEGHNRALYTLLLTQAHFKLNKVTETDTAINFSIAYFSQTIETNRPLLCRTFIYKGGVMYDLGDCTEALRSYRMAEFYCDKSDYFNLGYINMRIAELYRSLLLSKEPSIEYYKKSYDYFVKSGSLKYQSRALSNIGALYRIDNPDSAIMMLKKAITLDSIIGDVSHLLINKEMLAKAYYFRE